MGRRKHSGVPRRSWPCRRRCRKRIAAETATTARGHLRFGVLPRHETRGWLPGAFFDAGPRTAAEMPWWATDLPRYLPSSAPTVWVTPRRRPGGEGADQGASKTMEVDQYRYRTMARRLHGDADICASEAMDASQCQSATVASGSCCTTGTSWEHFPAWHISSPPRTVWVTPRRRLHVNHDIGSSSTRRGVAPGQDPPAAHD